MTYKIDLSKVILEILEITDYPDSREKFISDFSVVCLEKTLLVLIQKLSENERKEIGEEFHKNKLEKIAEDLKNHFSEEEYIKTLVNTSKGLVSDYIDDLIKFTSPEQKRKLLLIKKDL